MDFDLMPKWRGRFRPQEYYPIVGIWVKLSIVSLLKPYSYVVLPKNEE